MKSDHKQALIFDKEKAIQYYKSSIEKTEQQKFLEKILAQHFNEKELSNSFAIADIACGGGTLSFHLSKMFQNASFTLVDFNNDALDIAKSINIGKHFSFINDSIFSLNTLSSHSFDFVFCWQTLSWIDDPQTALEQLLRLVKPGGCIFLSSLFNLNHDVDIYSKVFDYTRESGKNRLALSYNTYSEYSVQEWLKDKIKSYEFMPFLTSKDFLYKGRGLGTFTVNTEHGRYQISGGQLLNWAVLKIIK